MPALPLDRDIVETVVGVTISGDTVISWNIT